MVRVAAGGDFDSRVLARHAGVARATSLGMNLLHPLRRGSALLLFCALAFGQAPVARALPIVIEEQQRSVAADAAASTSAENDAADDADQSLLPGAASLVATAAAAVLDASATSDATQQSDVGAAQLAGSGTAASASDAPGADAFSLGSAESQLRIVFTATADSLLRLLGRIEASGGGAGDASALLELSAVDSTLDPLLLLYSVAPGESLDVDVPAMLHAGIEYRLVALARANGDALDGETGAAFSANFDFALTEVPEPATALMLTLGLALLTKRRRSSST